MPTLISNNDYDVVETLPPVVHKPDNMIFPFCIVRRSELEKVAQRTTEEMTDAEGLVQCSKVTWYPTQGEGNITAIIKLCKTGPKARIRCGQIVPNGGAVIYEHNSSHIAQYRLQDLSKGTRPLGDVFWMCEHNVTMTPRLPENWTGIRAPLMLTGQLSLITQKLYQAHAPGRNKRNAQESSQSGKNWETWKWE